MRTHELKTWPGPFEDVVAGRKTHEVRKDDRGFEVGDTLVLREWVPGPQGYTGRSLTVTVTYITRGWGLPDDMCVMSIAPLGCV